MLHPSYSDLMKVVNSEVEQGEAPVVNSRYSIVMATSKRARQIISGDEPLVNSTGKKPLSVAVEELNQGKIKILAEDEMAEEQESGALAEAEEMSETQEQEAAAAEEAEEQEA
ncbi:MAG: DNA-directed RNA polymerase subunit omega [Acetatifactor sp.]|nr:DNA-directed RNA polymerase subunit omega [Acetatifactor sp.]